MKRKLFAGPFLLEHKQNSFKGKWKSSNTTENCFECHGQLNWINPKTLSSEQHYQRQKIRESLEIKKANASKYRKNFNHGEANLAKTNTCNTLFVKLIEKKPTERFDVIFINSFATILFFICWKKTLI